MMMVPSEKADMRAAKAVEFSRRHGWAKYPCVAAVSVIYSCEYLRISVLETGRKIREAVCGSESTLRRRVTAAVLSAAFTFMSVPIGGIAVYADETVPDTSVSAEAADEAAETDGAAADGASEDGKENEDRAQDAEAEDIGGGNSTEIKKTSSKPRPHVNYPVSPAKGKSKKNNIVRADEPAKTITLEGLAEDNPDYGIKFSFDERNIKKDITVRFRQSRGYYDSVVAAFESYGISTEELNIRPVDVTVYTTEDRYKLQLTEGYTADITLPIPEDMTGHTDDLRIVRLEKDNSITILDGFVRDGDKVSFNTDHFSIFALVSYKDRVEDHTNENIGSGSGMAAGGMSMVFAPSVGGVFEEDRRRFPKKKRRRMVYKIKRIAREDELLLL